MIARTGGHVPPQMTAIVWFRRDLRVHDHPALRAALDAHDRVVPVFVLDDRILRGRHASGPRTQFMLECLEALDDALERRGGRLAIRHGAPARELVRLAEETGARDVYFTRDVSPYARARGEEVARAAGAAGLRLHGCPGLLAAEGIKPYRVFSPFHRAWLEAPRRDVLGAPRAVAVPSGLRVGRRPSLEALGLEQEVEAPPRGGEPAARERLSAFLRSDVLRYDDNHDALGGDRTSRLSPYLRFGCLSPREVEKRLPRGRGPEAFRRQLCWRDFYQQLLLHHPAERASGHRRTGVRWEDDDGAFDAWREGRTGYPLVDAGMRQLRHEGWMHNRARLMVGSFLTKHLGIDWRRGERWFMRLLVDGDEANNNGNWQWIGSVGVDPQPVSRRVYNPTLQMERYDPEGAYVRRWIPELREVPDRWLREPWTMPEEVQREAGCVIGEDYPEPIVEHASARRAALARYGEGG